MEHYSLTDIGLYRQKNQDAYLTIANNYGDFLALVCDGIGGAPYGEVASREAVNYFERIFKKSGPFNDIEDAKSFLSYHLQRCNEYVFDLSQDKDEYNGMGTTITGIFVSQTGNLSINIGDSRVYGFLDNKIFSLTIDDTYVNQLIRNGELSYEESLNHPKKHYLIRALGVYDYTDFDIHKVRKMEQYLVCSDGLYGGLSDDELLDIMNNNEYDCQNKANKLLELALLKGGYDNISLIVIKC